jgi:6-phosphofructokinase 1
MVGVEDGYVGPARRSASIPLDHARMLDEASRQRWHRARHGAVSKIFPTAEGQRRAREKCSRKSAFERCSSSAATARSPAGRSKCSRDGRGRSWSRGSPPRSTTTSACTSMAIGVDTAMNTIVEACDRICDTATAHRRTFLVEVMGRDCGYLAMTSGIAAGADTGARARERRERTSEVVDQVCRHDRARLRERGAESATRARS